MSNTRTAIGTLIAVLSLGASAIGPSPVYAKDRGVHSFRPHGIYAQASGQELLRAVKHGATIGYPSDEIINPTDYQRGGSN